MRSFRISLLSHASHFSNGEFCALQKKWLMQTADCSLKSFPSSSGVENDHTWYMQVFVATTDTKIYIYIYHPDRRYISLYRNKQVTSREINITLSSNHATVDKGSRSVACQTQTTTANKLKQTFSKCPAEEACTQAFADIHNRQLYTEILRNFNKLINH